AARPAGPIFSGLTVRQTLFPLPRNAQQAWPETADIHRFVVGPTSAQRVKKRHKSSPADMDFSRISKIDGVFHSKPGSCSLPGLSSCAQIVVARSAIGL